MKNLELKNTELVEMNATEMTEKTGGLLYPTLVSILIDAIKGNFTIWV